MSWLDQARKSAATDAARSVAVLNSALQVPSSSTAPNTSGLIQSSLSWSMHAAGEGARLALRDEDAPIRNVKQPYERLACATPALLTRHSPFASSALAVMSRPPPQLPVSAHPLVNIRTNNQASVPGGLTSTGSDAASLAAALAAMQAAEANQAAANALAKAAQV
jgi:hypothetical protein